MIHMKKILIVIVTIFLICLINIYYKLSIINNSLENIKKLNYSGFKLNSRAGLESGNSEYNRTVIEDFVINTPGCYIPNYAQGLIFNESIGSQKNISCGSRAIFIERRPSNKIKFRIDTEKFAKIENKTKTKKFQCCYRFISRSSIPGREDTHISYSPCVTFKHGTVTNLDHEVITVRCDANVPKEYYKRIIYEDAYIIFKNLNRKVNRKKLIGKPWNVVVLGINSMSRERILSAMPQTAQYLQENNWLNFKGYHKVAWNSYLNMKSLLTGNSHECSLHDMKCNEYIIWNKFKNAGYVTAYGEDHITLTNSLRRNNFKVPPTDHYMHPFFLTGEKRINNLICMKNIPSFKNVLNYAYDFIDAYKGDPYFGFFWLNSNPDSNHGNVSLNFDSEISDFFRKLQHNKLLNNTFVIFLSTHGNKYGEMRIPISSYYDDRSPMFFMWPPDEFKKANSSMYHNLQLNQMRLTTPYDIYATFVNVLKICNKSLEANQSVACPGGTNLFEEISPHRTCLDACVNENWCICHDMINVTQNEISNRAVQLIVSYIQNRTNSIKTIVYTACEPLHLDNVLRIHMYKSEFNKLLYVVALKMSPGNLLYEATVEENGKELTIHKESNIFSISPNNGHGYCVINEEDRQYCFCKKTL